MGQCITKASMLFRNASQNLTTRDSTKKFRSKAILFLMPQAIITAEAAASAAAAAAAAAGSQKIIQEVITDMQRNNNTTRRQKKTHTYIRPLEGQILNSISKEKINTHAKTAYSNAATTSHLPIRAPNPHSATKTARTSAPS